MTEYFKNFVENLQKVSDWNKLGLGAFQYFSNLFHFLNFIGCWLRLSRTVWVAAYGMETTMPSSAVRKQLLDRTSEAVNWQIAAMGVQVFEIGLFKPDANADGQSVMIPRTWDVETVIRSIPWLRLQNADGRNIYIRPQGEHNLSLVDDLSADAVRQMKASGFDPAVVVETSPGNFQAWLKHPRVLPRELSTATARALAQQFGGDLGAADWRHFGRLCGFTNRKPKYVQESGLFPFVRLIEAGGKTYSEGERFLEGIEAKREEELQNRERLRSTRTVYRQPRSLKDIDSFRADPRYARDGTRVDLAFAIYAISHGLPVGQVEAAIRSRDLSHKGNEKRQLEYVERTIRKATAAVTRCPAERSR